LQTVAANSEVKHSQVLTDSASDRLQTTLQKNPQKDQNEQQKMSPDLAEIVGVWPQLPEHTKAAIKALVQTNTSGKREPNG